MSYTCTLLLGSESFDKILAMILGNPTLAGTVIAFFLDNTVPGNILTGKNT